MTDVHTRAPAVLVRHTLDGVGKSCRHVVSISDPGNGKVVAEFEGARLAAQWLRDGAYRYVAGSNGEWDRR